MMLIQGSKNIIIPVLLLLLLAGTGSFSPAHKFYLGLAEVHVNTKKHTLNVSCKLFRDDLEEALRKKSGKKFDLSGTDQAKAAETDLSAYLRDNFKINVGGKLQTLSFLGYETEEDAVWLYLETNPFHGKGRVALLNTLLYELFPDQVHMISVDWDGTSKSAKLSNPEKMVEFDF